jgi:hypothetical protein
MNDDESTPKGAHESATTGLSIPQRQPVSTSDAADVGAQLGRLEDVLDNIPRSVLDNIPRSLAPMVGAR